MRLGTSGLGVIAAVSLLVTAAPERNEGNGNNRESSIDYSRNSVSWLVSRLVSSSDIIDDSRDRLVKIENDKLDSLSKLRSPSIPLSPSSRTTIHRSNDQSAGRSPPEVSRFPIDFIVATRASQLSRNFGESTDPDSNVRSNVNSFEDKPSYKVRSDSSATDVSTLGNPVEKLVLSIDSPVTNVTSDGSTCRSFVQRDRHRRAEPEAILRDGEAENGQKDERSRRREDELTKTRTVRSSQNEAAITMSNRSTTMTSAGTNEIVTSERNFVDVNYIKTIGSSITKNSPESRSKKENTNIDKSHAYDDKTDLTPDSIHKTISLLSENRFVDSNDQQPTDHSINLQPNVHSSITKPSRNVERINHQEKRNFQRLSDDSRIVKLTNIPLVEDRSNSSRSNDSRRDSSVRDLTTVRGGETTPKTSIEVTVGEQENSLDSGVTEKITRAKQIIRGSLPDVSIIGTESLRSEKNIGNNSGIDIDLSNLDNHKAVKVRSFQTTKVDNEKSEDSPSTSISSRLPANSTVEALNRDESSAITRKMNPPTHTANQMTFAKSVNAIVKNSTKQSINLLDGESNKIFYEIKPSLITDMDRNDDVDYTTTTRRSFEKFLLPSVPSALGKFGPYFLDEEDRRNVTERIGNTVQLDCRIGMLGHRKVTWLQHYKDSFRLLTVERESYSVDQRISLNFQYPDNWRLQIAYASFRDSGLYKCQVEIDQDKSLVKRYNVIITAPNLTITDDSGRAVSGERHLKAGSALKLRCEARDVLHGLNESVLWMRGDETLTDDVSENRTTEIVSEKEMTVVISTLLIERAVPRHAGNYSCIVPDKARTTIAVHVLNGELPAAVQHGSGVSTAVLNIWLVHLTASYGFFR